MSIKIIKFIGRGISSCRNLNFGEVSGEAIIYYSCSPSKNIGTKMKVG